MIFYLFYVQHTKTGIAGGNPVDYAYSVGNANYAFVVRLPGTTFIVPNNLINNIVTQWWEALKLAVDYMI